MLSQAPADAGAELARRRHGSALRVHGEVSGRDRLRCHQGVRRDPGIAAHAPSPQQARADLGATGRPAMKAPSRTKLLRVAGLPAVSALFATAPQRVERVFFDRRIKSQVSAFCAELARARKSYRMVEADELERVAGSVMHGGIVALAEPKPVPDLDLDQAAAWARRGEPL